MDNDTAQAYKIANLPPALPAAIRSAWITQLSKRGLIWAPLLMLLAIAVAPYLGTAVQLKWVLWLSFGIVALSLDLVWGKAGIFSFGQNALFGIGAYAYAITALNVFPITLETGSALIVAALVSALFAGLLGYAMFYGRVGDVYLAIVTLAVTLVLYTVMSSTAGPEYQIGEAQLGGFNGIPSLPSISLGWPGAEGNSEFGTRALFSFAVCLAGFLYIAVRFLVSGRFGAILAGLRENETRMELLGYDTRLYKLLAFVLGGAIAGLGGGLFAAWGTFVNPSVFGLSQAALVVIWVMVGGRGTLGGAFLGVILVQWMSDEANNVLNGQTPLILGAVLILVVLVFPGGLAPVLKMLARPLALLLPRPVAAGLGLIAESRNSASLLSVAAGDDFARPAARAGHMTAHEVVKNFGGLSVLRGVTLGFTGPGIHAVIGANGAGKSTLFGVLTGRLAASDGRIDLDGVDVTRLPPFRRARRGLGIKLQVPSIFMGLTVLENLELAIHASKTSRPSEHVEAVLDTIGLTTKMDCVVSTLSHGEHQWLEIAMVLAQNPSVILLDEPAAGMTQDERAQTVTLIHKLAKDHTVVVVEHDMAFIRALEAPVAMLHLGKVFRVGTFEEISSDPEVINVYLGRRDATRR